MTELIRPALYDAHHAILPVTRRDAATETVQVVGPVCETTDVLGRDVELPSLQPGDMLAILTAGAYGMVMASNYNARPRPPEVLIAEDGKSWYVARRRETFDDLVAAELDQ
jgi:diaminopimelate decarboxylase